MFGIRYTLPRNLNYLLSNSYKSHDYLKTLIVSKNWMKIILEHFPMMAQLKDLTRNNRLVGKIRARLH